MRIATTLVTGAIVLWSGVARATGVVEFPDNGSEAMARGGAWMVRASDPLATAYNPAGLAGQPSRVTVQSNIVFHHTCFSRIKSALDTSSDPLADPVSGRFPRVCSDIEPSFNPQIGVTLRVTPRLGVGFLVYGPSASATKSWPDFVPDGAGQLQASPQRYALIRQTGFVVFPTLGAGFEVIPGLRLGASVGWGVARLKLANASMALNTNAASPSNDIRSNLQVHDHFVPSVAFGALYDVSPEASSGVELGAWFKWTDAIDAGGDLGTAANFYTKQNAGGDDKGVRYGDSVFEDCGTGRPITTCGGGNNARFKLVAPLEAKVGARYRVLRSSRDGRRDPLANEVFDLEANLTWANTSAADVITVRFPGDASGKGILPVSGVQGGEVPPNADQQRGYKDMFGLRLGGDYNVLPDKVAVRAGAFYESSALDPRYQNIDFVASARFGLSVGGTYRVRVGGEREGAPPAALEFMVGYGHVFVAEQSRTDRNADGIPAIAGTSCNGSDPASPSTCADGSARYRSRWPVNLGTITNAINVINVGAAYRF